MSTPLARFYNALGIDPDEVTGEPYEVTWITTSDGPRVILNYRAITNLTADEYAAAVLAAGPEGDAAEQSALRDDWNAALAAAPVSAIPNRLDHVSSCGEPGCTRDHAAEVSAATEATYDAGIVRQGEPIKVSRRCQNFDGPAHAQCERPADHDGDHATFDSTSGFSTTWPAEHGGTPGRHARMPSDDPRGGHS